jgi:hypothetical protein
MGSATVASALRVSLDSEFREEIAAQAAYSCVAVRQEVGCGIDPERGGVLDRQAELVEGGHDLPPFWSA